MQAIWTLDGDATSWASWAESMAQAPATPLICELVAARPAQHSGRALDIGCGTGRAFAPLCEAGYQVVGIDPIARGLEFARNKALRSRIPARPLQASAAHLPLADGSMGFSVAIGTLYHLSCMELACALREVRRVLRPGGEANLHFLDIDDWRRSLAPEIRPEEAPVPSYEAVVTCFCSAGTIQQWIEQARLQLLSLELRTSESEAGQQRNWLAHCRR